MFQKDMYKFSKREGMYKGFFNDFQMFQSLYTKEYFLIISSNVYSKSMYKDFSKYIFLCTFKKIFQWFFLFKMYMYKEFERSQEYVQTSKWKYVQKLLFIFFFFQNFTV